MERLDATAVRAVRTLIAAQPATEAKVAFAWKIAAGPAVARSTEVQWSDRDRVLQVRAATEEWRHEVAHMRATLFDRVTLLLGPGVVSRIDITERSRASMSDAKFSNQSSRG